MKVLVIVNEVIALLLLQPLVGIQTSPYEPKTFLTWGLGPKLPPCSYISLLDVLPLDPYPISVDLLPVHHLLRPIFFISDILCLRKLFQGSVSVVFPFSL